MPATARRGGVRFIFAWSRSRPSVMGNNLNNRAKQMTPTLVSRLTGVAERMQSYAQANAPWTDRTGDARRTLNFRLNQGENSATIIGRHGVRYGGFLETGTSRNKPYPIIGPTLQAHYAEVRSVMNEIAGSG